MSEATSEPSAPIKTPESPSREEPSLHCAQVGGHDGLPGLFPVERVEQPVPLTTSSPGVAARELASMARRGSAGDAGASSRKRNEASGVRAPPEHRTNLWSAALDPLEAVEHGERFGMR